MSKKQGNSLLETRRRNRVLIKSMIFRTENATRTGIADSLGLTLPTITTSVNEMLSEGILEEVAFLDSQLVNTLGEAIQALKTSVDAILQMSKLEAGAETVNRQPFNLRVYLRQLSGRFAPTAAAKNLDLTLVVALVQPFGAIQCWLLISRNLVKDAKNRGIGRIDGDEVALA